MVRLMLETDVLTIARSQPTIFRAGGIVTQAAANKVISELSRYLEATPGRVVRVRATVEDDHAAS